jgi:predicted permease
MMKGLADLLAQICGIFGMIAIGFAVSRKGWLSEVTLNELSHLIMTVLMPAFIFYSIATSVKVDMLSKVPIALVAGILVCVVDYVLAASASGPLKVAGDDRSVFRVMSMTGNTGYIGLPLCAAIFGAAGTFFAVLFNFGCDLVILTVGIWDLRGGMHTGGAKIAWRPLLLNPLILAAVAGILWAVSGLGLPALVGQPLALAGQMTLPAALLMVGAQLGKVTQSNPRFIFQIAGSAAIRMLVSPLLFFVVIGAVWTWEPAAQIMLLLSAMPVGISPTLLGRACGRDTSLSATAALWTTALSPLILAPLIFFISGGS